VGPLHVRLMATENAPQDHARTRGGHFAEVQDLAEHEEQDEAAVGVDGRESGGGDDRGRRGGRDRPDRRHRAGRSRRHGWGVILTMTTSWGATFASNRPANEPTSAFFHKSRTRAFPPGARLMSSQEMPMLPASVPRLKRMTAFEPSPSGFIHTSWGPLSRTLRPCMPRASWSTAITSGFVRISRVSADMLRRSLPAMRGAASRAQKL